MWKGQYMVSAPLTLISNMLDFGHNYILEGPEKWTSILPEPPSPHVHFHPLSRNLPSPPSGGRPLYTVPWMKLTTIYFFRCHNRYWFLHRSSAKRSNRLKSLHDPQDGVGRRAFGRYIQYRRLHYPVTSFGQLD